MDQVVCIRDDWGHKPNLKAWPVVGGIYTIRRIELIKAVRDRPRMAFYVFHEIVNPLVQDRVSGLVEPIFDAAWFRPVRRTSIDQFKKIMEPA